MTHRERVLKTFRFEQPDRVAHDMMEGSLWGELREHFQRAHGLDDDEKILDFLDTDCRWKWAEYQPPPADPPPEEHPPADEPPPAAPPPPIYSGSYDRGPLTDATTVAEVEAMDLGDPGWWVPGDVAGVRRRRPDHALVLMPGWMPLFWGACEAFGMSRALMNFATEPKLVEAYIRRKNDWYLDILGRCLKAAEGLADICWLGDDYAGQENLLIDPALWRKHVKPHLARQVRLVRDHGLYPLMHSCGAIRDILPDMIDIGVQGMLVFQTTARGMDAASIARDFGGKLVFYGGIDIQQLLSFGTPEKVRAEVLANVRAFDRCGGYVVANSHHGVSTVRGENVVAMCEAARQCTFPLKS